ncbi:unnamed protein product [Ilex paraguariensis]|uniref:Uncharacterized protein n=1 Tax=Ilex paraguariensis TaxID=185542 RepID=A0ABC8QZM3_9AQUA
MEYALINIEIAFGIVRFWHALGTTFMRFSTYLALGPTQKAKEEEEEEEEVAGLGYSRFFLVKLIALASMIEEARVVKKNCHLA